MFRSFETIETSNKRSEIFKLNRGKEMDVIAPGEVDIFTPFGTIGTSNK